MRPGSMLGVHQFYFQKEGIDRRAATAASQLIAGKIVNFIIASRADPSFFRFITETMPTDMLVVPHDKLRALRVVTDNIYDEKWEFEYSQGITWLRLHQISDRGENKLVLVCAEGRHLIAQSFVGTLHKEEIIAEYRAAGIFIDGDLTTIEAASIMEQPRIRGEFVSWTVALSKELAAQIIRAESSGAALQPKNANTYLGFQFRVAPEREKLSKMMQSCGG